MIKLLSIAVFAVAVATVFSESAIRGLPGSACTSNGHCRTENSFCHKNKPCWEGVCTCKKGYTLYFNTTEDIGACIKDNKNSETCGWMKGECVGNLKCDRGTVFNTYSTGTCKCPYGTTADGEEWCTGTVALHGVCGTLTPTPDYSDWACTVFNDYYKSDMDATVDYLPMTCQLNFANSDYRCSCAGYYVPDTDNSTCKRMDFVAFDGNCTGGGFCDYEAVKGVFCNTTVTPNKCTCPWNMVRRNYIDKDGAEKPFCAHSSAILEVKEGHECDESSGDIAKYMYCEEPLVCGTCPEDGGYNVKLCMSGAAEMTLSLTVLAFSVYLTKYI